MKILEASYRWTQEWLQREDSFERIIDDDGYITLFRGTGPVDEPVWPGKVLDYMPNPLTSWTTSLDVAEDFATYNEGRDKEGMIIMVRIPYKRIVSSCQTGLGCHDEFELIAAIGDAQVTVYK